MNTTAPKPNLQGTLLQTVVDAVFPSWLPRFVKTLIISKLMDKLVEVGGDAVKRSVNYLMKKASAQTGDFPVELNLVTAAMASLAEDFHRAEMPTYLTKLAVDGVALLAQAADSSIALEDIPRLRFARFLLEHGFMRFAGIYQNRENMSAFIIAKQQFIGAWQASVNIGDIRSLGALLNKQMKTKLSVAPELGSVRFMQDKYGKSMYVVRYTWDVTGFRGEHTPQDAITFLMEQEEASAERRKQNQKADIEEGKKQLDETASDVITDDKGEPVLKRKSKSGGRTWRRIGGTSTWEKALMSTTTPKRAACSLTMTPVGSHLLKLGLNIWLTPNSARALANAPPAKHGENGDQNIIDGLEKMATTWLKRKVVVQGQQNIEVLDLVMEIASSFKRELGIRDVVTTPTGIAIFMDAIHSTGAGFWSKYIDLDPGKANRQVFLDQIQKQIRIVQESIYKVKSKLNDVAKQEADISAPPMGNFSQLFVWCVNNAGVSSVAEELGVSNEQVSNWYGILNEKKVKFREPDPMMVEDLQTMARQMWNQATEAYQEVNEYVEELEIQLDRLKSPSAVREELVEQEIKRMTKNIRALKSQTKDKRRENQLNQLISDIREKRLYVEPPNWKPSKDKTAGRFGAEAEIIRKLDAIAKLYPATQMAGKAPGESFIKTYFDCSIYLERNSPGSLGIEDKTSGKTIRPEAPDLTGIVVFNMEQK